MIQLSDSYSNDQMLDMYLFETTQNIEQLENLILSSEKNSSITLEVINEIFRMMHTIKGSSAMMGHNNISTLAHSIEDLFFFIRENITLNFDYSSLSDLVLDVVDFIKVEIEKIKSGQNPDGNAAALIENNVNFLSILKNMDKTKKETSKLTIDVAKQSTVQQNYFKAIISFETGCEMENIRAFDIIHKLNECAEEVYYIPKDIIEDDFCVKEIREHGFKIFFKTNNNYEKMHKFFMQTIFLKDLDLVQLENDKEFDQFRNKQDGPTSESPAVIPKSNTVEGKEHIEKELQYSTSQSIISVNVLKLDMLMDMVGEIVIAEAMVSQNPDLDGLILENFRRATQHLTKLITELQDLVMSIRMVPLTTTFQKMNRVVRDMSKKLNKEAVLQIFGEDTEVDKNIIEHISDPLMHLVRNSLDHGIEAREERISLGKPPVGTVTLEARNEGSEVVIIVKDDGKGLNKEKILKRARENDLLVRPENEMTDKEIYSLIFTPGFSTKENVTEFSGRGVGMDVVLKNIEVIGGKVSVESEPNHGSSTIIKIPITLAIIDGMNIRVGTSRYTVPITSIKESFRPAERDIIRDPDMNEMIMVRGNCFPIIRLHEMFNVDPDSTNIHEGILIMVENGEKTICIFADELIGEQQVVVKALPEYFKKIYGIAGCTLLGNGSISLILDIVGIIN